MDKTFFKINLQAADLRTEAPHSMSNRILCSLYPLVRDFPDAPLSLDIIKASVLAPEHEVIPFFDQMIKTGLIEKKYDYTSNVYKLTQKGIQAVHQAHAELQKDPIAASE